MRSNEKSDMTKVDKGIIVVPMTLLAKVDMNRDKLSRAEFVELCIDTVLNQVEGDADIEAAESLLENERIKQAKNPENPVSRGEFLELKENMKGMLRSFVESLPQQATKTWSRATDDAQQRSKQLKDLLNE
jgi:hypothetical protein